MSKVYKLYWVSIAPFQAGKKTPKTETQVVDGIARPVIERLVLRAVAAF